MSTSWLLLIVNNSECKLCDNFKTIVLPELKKTFGVDGLKIREYTINVDPSSEIAWLMPQITGRNAPSLILMDDMLYQSYGKLGKTQLLYIFDGYALDAFAISEWISDKVSEKSQEKNIEIPTFINKGLLLVFRADGDIKL